MEETEREREREERKRERERERERENERETSTLSVRLSWPGGNLLLIANLAHLTSEVVPESNASVLDSHQSLAGTFPGVYCVSMDCLGSVNSSRNTGQ